MSSEDLKLGVRELGKRFSLTYHGNIYQTSQPSASSLPRSLTHQCLTCISGLHSQENPNSNYCWNAYEREKPLTL